MNAELDEHLDDERVEGGANRRNGHSKKSVLTGTSKMTLSIPRDRAGTFDPKLIAKYQRRFPDFDDKIISMYARGMSVREIRGHLEELYGIDVSADLTSAVTDAVLEEVAEWQNRPLDVCYPLVFFDAIRVKIRDEGFVRNKAVYIALGIRPDDPAPLRPACNHCDNGPGSCPIRLTANPKRRKENNEIFGIARDLGLLHDFALRGRPVKEVVGKFSFAADTILSAGGAVYTRRLHKLRRSTPPRPLNLSLAIQNSCSTITFRSRRSRWRIAP